MTYKNIRVSHTAVGGMIKHGILMIVLKTAGVCVMSACVSMRLFDKFLEIDFNVTLHIARAKEVMGKEAAA